jgi:S1-C subfamily serine protease
MQGPTFKVRRTDEGRFVVTVLDGSSVELVKSPKAGLAPVVRDGLVAGLRLHGDLEGELAGALGLEPGDILLDINGVPFNDSQRLLESREVMFGAKSTTIRYRRNGEEQSVFYELQRVAQKVEL